MDPEGSFEPLLAFFKALSDANRLRIVGLLSHAAYSVEELAAMLGLRASTVSHHLSRLADAGLVAARAEGHYSIYSLRSDRLEEMARRLLSRRDLPAVADQVDLEAYDRKVLKDFLMPDGRLKTIPAQRKKLAAVLRHVADCFPVGKRLTEKQVNLILTRLHSDTATLRRELVGSGLMRRAGGSYWRQPPQSPSGPEGEAR